MTDTPHTDQFLQTMFLDLGSLGPHNCPEWLVQYARDQERELNQWKACAELLYSCATHDTSCDGWNAAQSMFEKLKGTK
jgi:hypothetical protein